MSELEQCPDCNGRKISRLGGIERQCKECGGIGHVKKKEPEIMLSSRLHEEDEPGKSEVMASLSGVMGYLHSEPYSEQSTNDIDKNISDESEKLEAAIIKPKKKPSVKKKPKAKKAKA